MKGNMLKAKKPVSEYLPAFFMARAKQGGGDVSPLSELSPVGLSDGDFFMRGVQPFLFSYKPIDYLLL